MNRLLLAGALLGSALMGSMATAADLPIKAPQPMVVESWTGFYVGGYVGGAFGTSDWINVDDPRLVGQADAHLKPSGFIGGGQAGYNYQINQLVVGIEAEGGWTNFSDTKNQPPDLCFPLG